MIAQTWRAVLYNPCMDAPVPLAGNDARFARLTDDITLMQARFTDHTFERHSHDCFSIGVTNHGVQRFRCKGRRHDSRAGDFVLFNPDEDHDGGRGATDGFRYDIWYVEESFVRSCIDADAGFAGNPYFAMPHVTDRPLAATFAALTRELAQAPSAMSSTESLRAESLLRAFIGKLLAHHGERAVLAAARHTDMAGLLDVKDVIRSDFRRDLKVAELAAVAGLSPAHLIRAFGAAFHVPPHVYLNAVRIRHAQALIRRGMPLALVAADCGFADQSHLSRRFKGSVGVAPAQWRRMMGAKSC